MPLKNIPQVIGADEPLRSWKEASASLRSNAVGLGLLGRLLEKADEAEQLLATAQIRLNELTAEVNSKEDRLADLEQSLATLDATYRAKQAEAESKIRKPLEDLQASVNAELARLRSTLGEEQAMVQSVKDSLAKQRADLEESLKQRKDAAALELSMLSASVDEKRKQLQDVTAALEAIKAKIG